MEGEEIALELLGYALQRRKKAIRQIVKMTPIELRGLAREIGLLLDVRETQARKRDVVYPVPGCRIATDVEA